MSLTLVKKLKYHIPLVFYYTEAFWYLLTMKLTILIFPFKFYSKKYGYAQSETPYASLTPAIPQIKAISTVLRILPCYLPWKSKCLDQAMAASRMLQKRNLPYTLYFGLTKNEQNTRIAHAWLRAGKHWIVGYQPHISYAIVGVYAWAK